jgi:hypothetical protein
VRKRSRSREPPTLYERARASTAFATLTSLAPGRIDNLYAEAREIDRRLGVAAVPAGAS